MNAGRYTISIADMAGKLHREQVGVFSSDADACTAARKLLRPGDRAIIMAGQKIIGRFTLAPIPHQIALVAEEPDQLAALPIGNRQDERQEHRISRRIRAWVRELFWRPLAR